jgi:hypothetical protein
MSVRKTVKVRVRVRARVSVALAGSAQYGVSKITESGKKNS